MACIDPWFSYHMRYELKPGKVPHDEPAYQQGSACEYSGSRQHHIGAMRAQRRIADGTRCAGTRRTSVPPTPSQHATHTRARAHTPLGCTRRVPAVQALTKLFVLWELHVDRRATAMHTMHGKQRAGNREQLSSCGWGSD